MFNNFIQLGDFVKILSGFAFKSELFNEEENGLPLIRIRDVNAGKSKTYYSGEYPEEYVVNKGDLLITMDGEFKIRDWMGEKALLNQRVCKIESNSKLLLTNYLLYLLPSILKNIEDKTAFVTVKHLSIKEIQKIRINLPTIEIQQKIICIIEKTNNLIYKRQSQIKALDELTQSVFLEMFGDEKYKTKLLNDISLVRSSKRVFVEELVSEGIPFYRGTEIGSLASNDDITPTLFITEERYNNFKESSGIPFVGDLLLPSICPDGRIWRVESNEPFYFKDGRVLWIHFTSQELNTVFIKYALKEKLIRDYNKIASGTTFAELKIFSLKNIELVFPPLELQNKFAEIINEIEKNKVKMSDSLNQLQSLYNSLLQRAFKGELFQDN